MQQYLRFVSAVILFSCLVVLSAWGQSHPEDFYTCSGRVVDPHGVPISGTNLLLEGLGKKGVSDSSGYFIIKGVPNGHHVLRISHLGHQAQTVSLVFEKNKSIELSIVLKEQHGLLQEVKITAKSADRIRAEQPILTQVVNTRVVQEQPSSLIELLNRSAGIRVRQTGGLGAPSNLMINGFQNRSIRYFKDGIPLDYLGSGFDISLVPVNMLERVEVYKGVLPPFLGSDALGGALNLVTKETAGQQLDFSYEIGSFNTHRASLNGIHTSKNGHFFVGANAFYNYSDNDYQVDVKVADPMTGVQSDARVPLFHNQFDNYYAEGYAGLRNLPWADELRLGLTAFSIRRQINYGASMNQAIGAAKNEQHAVVPTIRYRKAFLGGKLNWDQFGTWNTLHTQQVDTAKGQYNWLGEFIPSDSRLGELNPRGSFAKLRFRYYTSRSHLTFALSDAHQLDFNMVLSGFSRTGSDPYGARFASTGIDALSRAATYDKQVYGLGLISKLLNGRLNNQLVLKHYRYQTEATDADYQGNELNHQNKNHSWGLAEAVKYDLNEHSYARLSAETALRLPEQDELFGDGDRKLTNFALQPERSMNINLGFRTSFREKHSLEINSFYRVTKDMILQVPYNFLYTQSQNIDHVRGFGLEVDGAVTLRPWLKANGNFTYQNQRIYGTGNPSVEHSRLRNTPYFFANMALNGSFQRVFKAGDHLDVYWYYLFVRQYYLNALPKDQEPGGFLGLWGDAKIDAQNVIPNQHMHTAGITYTPAGLPIHIGLQVKNVFDKAIYDQFRIQNPGRNISLKVTYSFQHI